jgi:pyrroline-5-carboxylate reductase
MGNKKLAILGSGNIGIAIAEGLVQSQLYDIADIQMTKRNLNSASELMKNGFNVSSDNLDAVEKSDIIILAVQPKQLRALLNEISDKLNPTKSLVSVVTGVGLSAMQEIVGDSIPLYRAMPNTAISIQQSITCIATHYQDEERKKEIVNIFDNLGRAVVIEEELMASATVLGACGVAYALRFIRAASQGGIEIGFDADIAQLITSQTVVGAASLLLSTGKHPEREIDKVTTPQGCTIAGLNEMEHQGFSSALIKGLKTSYIKISTIAKEE